MPIYNLLEYSQNYGMNYYRDKTGIINNNASDGKSFKYKTKIVGKTPTWPGDQQYHLSTNC